jgi:hypothetical protein
MKPNELNVGDIFYECQSGFNIQAKVTTQPKSKTITFMEEEKIQWQWTAVNVTTGEEINYCLTEGLEHYGPRLYSEPQYVYVKDGEFDFKLS